MPIPSPADFRDKTKKHSEVREMLAQMAENAESRDGAQEKANAVLELAKQNATRELGTNDTRLLSSLHVILNAISQFREDYDADLIALNNDISANKNSQTLSSAANANSLQNLSLGLSVLNYALFQASDDIKTNSANLEMSSATAQSNISRLFVAISQMCQVISDNRDEIDLLIQNVKRSQNGNADEIQKIDVGMHQLTASVADVLNYVNVTFDSGNQQKEKLMSLLSTQEMHMQLEKLHGFDPASAATGGAPIITENILMFPEPNQVIKINVSVTGELPTAKGVELNSATTFNIDGNIYSGFSTLEVQGSSSATFPKKNWTISLFTDESRTKSQSMKIGYMLPHSDWVFKANFVDNTHARNIAMNRLWRQMVKTRKTYPQFEPDMLNMNTGVGLSAQPTGATGHVDGYPAVMYVNDIFYGIGSLNIGKKRDNYNLKSNDQKHIQLDPNGHVNIAALPLNPLDPPSSGSTIPEAFEIRRPSSWEAGAQSSYERFRDFLSKSKTDMEALGIDNYINRVNMIDYIILCQVCDLWDHLHKNTLYTTWDGKIWSFMPYDLDSVWGLHFTGRYYDTDGVTELHPASRLTVPSTGGNSNWGTLAKFRLIYGADVDNRYKELRASVLTVENILGLCEELTRKYPIKLFEAENQRWNLVENGTIYQTLQQTGSLKQIHDWLSIRLPLCDSYFNYSA